MHLKLLSRTQVDVDINRMSQQLDNAAYRAVFASADLSLAPWACSESCPSNELSELQKLRLALSMP